jgi:hypothetical protein
MDLGDARGERRLRIRYAARSRSSIVLRAAFLEGEGVLGDVLVNTGAATSTITPRAKRKMFMDSLIGKHRAIADSFQEIRKIGTAFSEKERLLAFDHFERTLLRLLMEEERLAFLP